LLPAIVEQFKAVNSDVFVISAVTRENLTELLHFISQKVDEIEKPVSDVVVHEDLGAYDNDDSTYEILKLAKDTYSVVGGKIKRLAQVTDARNTEQVLRLQHIMDDMGIFKDLKSLGVKDGDTIIVGHLELVYYDDEIWGEE